MVKLNTVLAGDTCAILKNIPSNTVNSCVTSPPYYNLRDYKVKGQIGKEKTPGEYIERLVSVFLEVKRVLKDDGTLWIVIGDSYAGSRQQTNKGGKRNISGEIISAGDCKPKDLLGIPWMLAFALRNAGYFLRQEIIWHKPNPMPESVKDRCTKAHEYIFLLSKSRSYYFDAAAIAEPAAQSTIKRLEQNIANQKGSKRVPGKTNGTMHAVAPGYVRKTGDRGKEQYILLRNKRSVWEVATTPFSGEHFATYPSKLIEPCILASCPVGGIVLDPFLGSGTTAFAALNSDRNFIGIELNPQNVELANRRIYEHTKFTSGSLKNSLSGG